MSDEREDKVQRLVELVRAANQIVGCRELDEATRLCDELCPPAPPEPTFPDVRLEVRTLSGKDVVTVWPPDVNNNVPSLWRNIDGGWEWSVEDFRDFGEGGRPLLHADADELRSKVAELEAAIDGLNADRLQLDSANMRLRAELAALQDAHSDLESQHNAAKRELASRPDAGLLADVEQFLKSLIMLDSGNRQQQLLARVRAAQSDQPTPTSELAGKIVEKPPMQPSLVERLQYAISETINFANNERNRWIDRNADRMQEAERFNGHAQKHLAPLLADLAKCSDPQPGVTAEIPERVIRAAKRILRDTSDEVWCDNDDQPSDDPRYLADFVLRAARDRLRKGGG